MTSSFCFRSKKLLDEALPFVVDNEDTYSHGALDSLLSFLFPWSAVILGQPSLKGIRRASGQERSNKPWVLEQHDMEHVSFEAFVRLYSPRIS